MKKIIYTLLLTFILNAAYAQQTEFQVQLNSGLFSFTGKSAVKSTSINNSGDGKSGYTINPYGSKSGLSLGASANLKRVTKYNLIFGTDIGYEILRSKTDIDRVNGNIGLVTFSYNATGQTYLNFQFINLNPFIGYRIMAKKFPIDLTVGYDIGFCLDAKEKGKATASNGISHVTARERMTIKRDLRPRVQIATRYNKLGIYAGYSFGQYNYLAGFDGGSPECYSRIMRFGLTYQIK